MREKLTFSEKIRQRYHEIAMKEDEAMMARSRSYNEYFENWIEYQVTTPKGKKRIVRVYDGAWYTHKMSKKSRIYLMLIYCLMFVAAAALFCVAAVQVTAANSSKIMLFTECLALIGLVVSCYNLILYVTSPVKMTVGQFKSSSVALKKSLRYSVFSMGLNSAAMLVYAVVKAFTGSNIVVEFLCALSFALSCALSYGILYIEKDKVEYNITGSKPVPPPDGEKIKDRDLVL